MRRRILPAALPAFAAVTIAVTALTGCSASSVVSSAFCAEPVIKPGAVSDSITVSGGNVTINGLAQVVNAQRSELVRAEDRSGEAQPGSVVIADAVTVDAVTGEVMRAAEASAFLTLEESTSENVRSALNSDQSDTVGDQYLTLTALNCVAPGDQVAVVSTPMQSSISQLGTNPVATVFTVKQTFPASTTGRTRGLPNGFPAVATDDSGRPGIVLPPYAAPTEARIATRIEGKGEPISAESVLVGHVLTVDWERTQLQNTWENGPDVIGAEQQSALLGETRSLLNGLQVGSQVVILDPNGGTPVVHVVDILAAI